MWAADPSDPIINLFLKKGFITEGEAAAARAEIQALRTNRVEEMPALPKSKWKINENLDDLDLFGDVKVRYERRSVEDPGEGHIDVFRYRYMAFLGIRGTAFKDFYFGLRFETAANPRSPWVTAGASSSGVPYQGPFGKSTAGVNIGQAYLGWHRDGSVDLRLGKMPNPLITTPMVWDTDLKPEGAAEHIKYTVGDADFFATLGQFLYQDVNPHSASGGLGFNGLIGEETHNIFQFAWQGGIQYRFTTNLTATVAPTVYHYTGLQRSSGTSSDSLRPYFGDPFVGEGAFLGPGSGTVLGESGYGTSFSLLPGYGSGGFPLNQVGLRHLVVVDVPFKLDFKIHKLDLGLFGDVAYNLEGGRRAREAAAGYAHWLANQTTAPTVAPFRPQKNEDKAYQLGLDFANQDRSTKHPWELRAYWQHTEQYALDPNLSDSDAFEGRGNLEGFNVALSYGLTRSFIGTVRYARASRINKKIGTGGANQDIPQMNPIDDYQLLQFDLSFTF